MDACDGAGDEFVVLKEREVVELWGDVSIDVSVGVEQGEVVAGERDVNVDEIVVLKEAVVDV